MHTHTNTLRYHKIYFQIDASLHDRAVDGRDIQSVASQHFRLRTRKQQPH